MSNRMYGKRLKVNVIYLTLRIVGSGHLISPSQGLML